MTESGRTVVGREPYPCVSSGTVTMLVLEHGVAVRLFGLAEVRNAREAAS